MIPKKIHYWSGILITFFIAFHLLNHIASLMGAATHIAWMDSLRVVYRHPLIEGLLLLAVLVQIVSGVLLFRRTRDTAKGFWAKLQRWSGGYLALFFLIHLSAILGGRYVLHLDTNFYFGVAGLNTFPFLLFFVPYYGLAMVAFFAHIASIHFQKMKKNIFGITVAQQSKGILVIGICFSILTLYGLTNGFGGVVIPVEYNVLIGK